MIDRPRIAVIRGEALNPYEMQVFGAVTESFDVIAVGRRRPLHEVDRIPIPVTLLHSWGEVRWAAAVHRRARRIIANLPDRDRLMGLGTAVTGRSVLHAAETVLPVSEQAAEIAHASGARLVLTCWETIPFRYDDNPVLAARKLVVKAATSRYLAVTERARQALITEGVPPAKITVIPASIDTNRFRPTDDAEEIRRLWRVPPKSLVALYVGRLIQEKGVVELVRAFAHAVETEAQDAPRHLVLIGSGDQGERIAAAAAASGISERVHVRHGVSHAELPSAYSAADVVVAPSLTTPYWEEQFGMVLAEAMACGRALVTTSSGAIPEVVGDAAVIVAPYDVPALGQAVAALLADTQRRSDLGAIARAWVQQRYAVPVIADRLSAAYREVLGS